MRFTQASASVAVGDDIDVEVEFDLSVVDSLSVMTRINYTGGLSFVTASATTETDGWGHKTITYHADSVGEAAAYVASTGQTYSATIPITITEE